MTAADRAFAEARAQGLPEQVQDDHALDRVAALLAGAAPEGGAHAAA